MRVLTTYGAVLPGPLRSLDDSHAQHVVDLPKGEAIWVERAHHPPEVDRRDCLVGPVSVVLEGEDAEPGRDPLALFDLDPSDRMEVADVAAFLLAADARCRLMWDGRRAALLGTGENAGRLRAALQKRVTEDRRAGRVAAPQLRPRAPRSRPLAFPARSRRRVEYERGLARLAPRLADTGRRLRSWGAVGTAAAIESLLVEISAPQAGPSRPQAPGAVAIAEDRIGELADTLAPMSARRVPTLVEAAADTYVAALASRQQMIKAFAFFGSSLRLHLPVEREGFIELPAEFAESLGAWPLATLPLVRHELDPLGIHAPSLAEIAMRCHQLAGEQFRYALERWGVGDPRLERGLISALQEISSPADEDLPEPMSRIAGLVGAAEKGEGYVNETELMLLLAAGRVRPSGSPRPHLQPSEPSFTSATDGPRRDRSERFRDD
jgi:hypothetical protein